MAELQTLRSRYCEKMFMARTWLKFSSARYAQFCTNEYSKSAFFRAPNKYTPPKTDARSSQMYLATIVVAPNGEIKNYPAVYIWNQTPGTSNLTPAWDEFKIPEVVVK